MENTENTENTENNKINALNKRYFNSTKNYTLSLLNAFNNLKYYVPIIQNDKYINDEMYKVPISFGNYEKSIILENINEKELLKGNYNLIPRLILSFDSITRSLDRGTQKFQKFKKYIREIDNNSKIEKLEMSYNSIPYNFNFKLLLQARGLSMATQLTEQILSYFNPSMTLHIKEFPLFENLTETQILIEDPEFEIIEEFEDTQINIINVTFNLTIRGNIYQKIEYQYPIETVHIFNQIWDEYEIKLSKMASYFKYDIDQNHKPEKETIRYYNGTLPYSDDVKLPLEEMKTQRPDFSEPELRKKL